MEPINYDYCSKVMLWSINSNNCFDSLKFLQTKWTVEMYDSVCAIMSIQVYVYYLTHVCQILVTSMYLMKHKTSVLSLEHNFCLNFCLQDKQFLDYLCYTPLAVVSPSYNYTESVLNILAKCNSFGLCTRP